MLAAPKQNVSLSSQVAKEVNRNYGSLKISRTSRPVVGVVLLVCISAISNFETAFAETLTQESAPVKESKVAISEAQSVLKSVADLVREYFPKAKITLKDNSLHFEYKVAERMHPYNRRTVLSPDLDGILGDIEVKQGAPTERIIGFLEKPETVHSVLLMSPYSASDETWLSTKLFFQPITPLPFMDSFKKIIGSYDHPKAPAQLLESKAPSLTPPEDAHATQEALTDPSVTHQIRDLATSTNIGEQPSKPTSDGSTSEPGMEKYSYPEGKFSVKLPGAPQVKYTNQAGMRMVDYAFAGDEGTYNVSYVILPAAPSNVSTTQLLDSMSQSVVNSLKGLHAKQYPSALQGYSGCQIEMPELANKAGQSARFRIFIVDKFVYIIGVAGKHDWVNSKNSKTFLDTFQVNLPPTAADLRRESDRLARARAEEVERQRNQQGSGISRVQKDREKIRADYEFNRRR